MTAGIGSNHIFFIQIYQQSFNHTIGRASRNRNFGCHSRSLHAHRRGESDTSIILNIGLFSYSNKRVDFDFKVQLLFKFEFIHSGFIFYEYLVAEVFGHFIFELLSRPFHCLASIVLKVISHLFLHLAKEEIWLIITFGRFLINKLLAFRLIVFSFFDSCGFLPWPNS